MDTLPYFRELKVNTATKASGKLQVSFSLSDDDFKAAHADASLEDFNIDSVYRTTKDGIRHAVIKVPKFERKAIGGLAAKVVAEAQRVKATEVDVIIPEATCEIGYARFAFALGVANYRFDVKKPEVRKTELESVTLVHSKAAEYAAHEEFGLQQQIASSKNLARDFVNRRPNFAHVQYFIDQAKEIQKSKPDAIKLTVFHGAEQLLGEGLRLIEAVGRGSVGPPALVNLSYQGNPASEEYTAIVGKGIVYDQGGVNCKTTLLDWMWIDKGGACAVLAAFQGIVKLGLKVNVACTLALAENIISGSAYRTSDIVTSHKGLTVEVLNTDAEGRLVLADAMSWTQSKFKVGTLIDVATLTGAIIIALGENIAGAFVTDDTLSADLIEAGSLCYETFWRMPIDEAIVEACKGKYTDLKNISGSQWGGAIAGAAFLKYFVNDGVKFAHLDIAGTVKVDAPTGVYAHAGATGTAVGTLIHYFKKHQA